MLLVDSMNMKRWLRGLILFVRNGARTHKKQVLLFHGAAFFCLLPHFRRVDDGALFRRCRAQQSRGILLRRREQWRK